MKQINPILGFIGTIADVYTLYQIIKTKQDMETDQVNSELILRTAVFVLLTTVLVIFFIYLKLKNRIDAIKKFRDYEAIFLTDRFNEKTSGVPINENSQKSLYQQYSKAINEYNKAFSDMEPYGENDNTTSIKRDL